MGRRKGSKNADRNSKMYKPKTYAPSYWHADKDDSGKPVPGQLGEVHTGRGDHKAYVNVEEGSVPADAPIYVQGMVEDLDERDKVDQHWKGFHDIIDAGGWVRLVYGGPLDSEQFADKAEAEAKYGKRDREGFKKVAGKDRRTKVVNLTEFLTHPEYFLGWSEAELGWVRSGSIVGILFVLWRRMHEAGVECTELYGIIHNKDVRQSWSQDDRREHTVPKDKHCHILGRISKALTPEKIAEILGVNVECLTLPGNHYSYGNFLAYLMHVKYAWKAQYEPEEVATLVGTPYMAVYSVNHHDWMIGRSKMRDKRASSDHDLAYYLDLVRKGELTIHEMMLDDELFLIYCRHEKQFKDVEK
ncbi:MAG: replication protein [Atopobiaceae bacterium]|nr:replication protein [Atopobiaceae bacterium]